MLFLNASSFIPIKLDPSQELEEVECCKFSYDIITLTAFFTKLQVIARKCRHLREELIEAFKAREPVHNDIILSSL